jgi:hypothetical protein
MKEVITLMGIKLYHHSIDDNKNVYKMIEKSIQDFQIMDFGLNSAGGALARKPF